MPLTITPQPGNNLGQTRDLISGNFSLIENAFVVDHVDYGLMPDQGKHNQVTFPTHTGTIPANGLPVNTEIYLFNQVSATTNVNGDLWLQRGSGTPLPITASSQMQNGWTYLPSGILMKWGTAVVNNANSFTVTYPTGAGIPVFTTVFNVQISVILFNVFATVNTFTATNFTVGNSAGTAGNFSVLYSSIGM